MNPKYCHLTLATLAVAAALVGTTPAMAQVAGGTTTSIGDTTESTQLAMGWSVKKTLLGKTVYNDAGQRVGKVDDLIISPDKNVSFVIVGAGGFIGLGRHDVAIPVAQIQNKAGKLVMAGATQASIKAMPAFSYADDSAKRAQFVSAAESDIAKGQAKIADLDKKAGTAAADAKATIDAQVAGLRTDVKEAEAKLSDMKQATASRWKEFEASVSAATARVRKSIDGATG